MKSSKLGKKLRARDLGIPFDGSLGPLAREATVLATEEAIINALIAAETMTGRDGNKVMAIPHDRLRQVLKKYRRQATASNLP